MRGSCRALRLEEDLALLATDDDLGRKLHEAGIMAKLRAPRRLSVAKDKIELDLFIASIEAYLAVSGFLTKC